MINDITKELNTFFKWLESEQNQSNRKDIPNNQRDWWRGYYAAINRVFENSIYIRSIINAE